MKLEFTSTRISRGGKPFEEKLKAPEYVHVCPVVADPIPKYRRSGHGNYLIKPPAFYSAPPKARILQFDNMAVSSISTDINQTTKLLREAYVQIPDILDDEWIKEEARLRASLAIQFTAIGRSAEVRDALVAKELLINKPLGRDQRTVERKTADIANIAGLTTANKLLEILNEIKAGRVENVDERRAMTGQLIAIFNKPDAVRELTELKSQELQDLGLSIRNLGFPNDNRNAGIPDLVDNKYWLANKGVIVLYLISNAVAGLSGLNTDNPVRSTLGNAIQLGTMTDSLAISDAQSKKPGGKARNLLYVKEFRLVTIPEGVDIMTEIVATNNGSFNVEIGEYFFAKVDRKPVRVRIGFNGDVFDSRTTQVVPVAPLNIFMSP
jgi:hypothetical protein